MKTLRMILGGAAVVALLGMSTVIADIQNGSGLSGLTFSLDVGSSSSMADVSFDTPDGEESQSTCAMTPGGTGMSMPYEEPVNPIPNPEYYTSSPQATLAPINSLQAPQTQTPGTSGRRYVTPPPPVIEEEGRRDQPPVVPEPATLVLMGLGLGAVVAARRRRENS